MNLKIKNMLGNITFKKKEKEKKMEKNS